MDMVGFLGITSSIFLVLIVFLITILTYAMLNNENKRLDKLITRFNNLLVVISIINLLVFIVSSIIFFGGK